MQNRFGARPDPSGFTVFDRTTGEVVTIAMIRQVGLNQGDAEHTAEVLNARDAGGAAPQQA